MINSQSSVVNRFCSSHKDLMAAYRVLRNDSWSVDDVVRCMSSACADNVRGLSHVLCIEDTTELNFDNMSGRLSPDDPDFGPGTEKNMEYSIFLHPCLVVDPESHTPLGFSHAEVWSRSRDRSHIPDRHDRSLEGKESYKWAWCAEKTASCLPGDVLKTILCDREGDIYEAMLRISDCGCHFLIRSRFNRALDDGHMWDAVLETPVAFNYDMVVSRKGEPRRTAQMELRWERVTVKCPRRCVGMMPDEITVTCVYTREVPGTTPDGIEPVEWKLLTSHEVTCLEDAMRIVYWYRLRWLIEEVFSVMKSRGMDVGDSQLESGKSMKKLIILSLYATFSVVAAKMAMDSGNEDMPASIMFSSQQVATLYAMMGYLHGLSPCAEGGNNPYREESMPWASWIIARMGGWSGYYKAHGRPGYKNLSKGFEKFHTWHAARCQLLTNQENVYKD